MSNPYGNQPVVVGTFAFRRVRHKDCSMCLFPACVVSGGVYPVSSCAPDVNRFIGRKPASSRGLGLAEALEQRTTS